MKSLHSIEASEYLDSLCDDIAHSAALAIHLTWVDYSSSLAKSPISKARSPLDFLALYQSMVYAFDQQPKSEPDVEKQYDTSHDLFLKTLGDPQILYYGRRYLSKVAEIAKTNSSELDIEYYANLFVTCVNRGEVDSILSGKISRDSKRLEDPDYW